MNRFKKYRANMEVNVIGGLVSILLLFALMVCFIGNFCIVNAFKDEYSSVTYHMADAAAEFVNGDHIDRYLAGEEPEEYSAEKRMLDTLCLKMNVSLIYVIKVDRSDYGTFVSVFNSVNNSVDDSDYSEWKLGYERDTTNEEYREKYRALYEDEAEYETVFRLHPEDGRSPHITTLVPVENSEGEIAAILCIQRPLSEMRSAMKPYFLFIFAGVSIMVILTGIMASRFLKRSIIRPVAKVSNEAARFARETTKGDPLGDISKYEAILELARSIDSMETDMIRYIENLTAVTAEKERISAELSIAAMIQNDALPSVFPPFPDRNEFEIFASMDPAREVGGDFYNFFFIDDDHLALVMADVSDKGIPAALFMMVNSILIEGRTLMGGTPSEILEYVNNRICMHNQAEMFITVWLGILEISTGRLISANAGHEKPCIYRKDGVFDTVNEKHGFVLGGMEGVRYKDNELRLEPGDKLFLYTDGVPEATDSKGSMYTVDRMVRTLNVHRDESPQSILDGITSSVSDFVGDARQTDDLTMLCLEYVTA